MYPQIIVNFHLSEKHTVVFGGYCLLSDCRSWSVFLAINLSEKCFSGFFVWWKITLPFSINLAKIIFRKPEFKSVQKKKINHIFFQWRVNHNTMTIIKKRNKKEYKAPMYTVDLHAIKWRIVSFFNGLYDQNSKNYH